MKLREIYDTNIDERVDAMDLQQVEKFADKLFGKVGIDVEFTRHFLDRVNDERNGKPITPSELTRIFRQEYKRWGKPIAKMGPDQQAVMKDLQTDINIPFALVWDKNNNELDLVAKTIMRKKDFKTPNKTYPIENQQVDEWGRIVKGVNTTSDVDKDEIKTQAAKFGNTVDKDGRPPKLGKKTRGSKTNVLYNLGLAESKNNGQPCPRTRASLCQCESVKQVSEGSDDTPIVAYAELEHGDGVEGTIMFMQKPGTPTLIKGKVTGLEPGEHGFHIHEYGDLSQGCESAGAHFNPTDADHGDLETGHVGDLGNITASEDGVADFTIKADRVNLVGDDSVVGRSIVVHSDEDDLGQGGDEESLKTGNSGDRVACGVIVLRDSDTQTESVNEEGSVDDQHEHGTYAALYMNDESARELVDWCEARGIHSQDPSKMHCTLIFSRNPVPEFAEFDQQPVDVEARITGWKQLGDALVLTLDCDEAERLNEIMTNGGATSDHESYIAHTTINPEYTDDLPEETPDMTLKYDVLRVEPLDPDAGQTSKTESASAGATAAGAVAANPTAASSKKKKKSNKNPDGTVKNALDSNDNVFGGETIKRRDK